MNKIDFYTLGQEAFARGALRVPAMDPAVAPALEDLPVGLGAADMLEGWLQGWDVANLAVPVE